MRELIEELPGQQILIVVFFKDHRRQTQHIFLEVGEVGIRLILWGNIPDVHPEAVWGLIVVICVQLQIRFHKLNGYGWCIMLETHHFSCLDIAYEVIWIAKYVRDSA